MSLNRLRSYDVTLEPESTACIREEDGRPVGAFESSRTCSRCARMVLARQLGVVPLDGFENALVMDLAALRATFHIEDAHALFAQQVPRSNRSTKE